MTALQQLAGSHVVCVYPEELHAVDWDRSPLQEGAKLCICATLHPACMVSALNGATLHATQCVPDPVVSFVFVLHVLMSTLID